MTVALPWHAGCQDGIPPTHHPSGFNHFLRDCQYLRRLALHLAHLCGRKNRVTRLSNVVRMGMLNLPGLVVLHPPSRGCVALDGLARVEIFSRGAKYVQVVKPG